MMLRRAVLAAFGALTILAGLSFVGALVVASSAELIALTAPVELVVRPDVAAAR